MAPPPKETYAFSPALAVCCATLEYFSGLWRGRTYGVSPDHIGEFCEHFLPDSTLTKANTKLLFKGLRHSVAHRGAVTGVLVDNPGLPRNAQKRYVWRLNLGKHKKSAIEIHAEEGMLLRDPPWSTPYSHRVTVNLWPLFRELEILAEKLSTEIENNPDAERRFHNCMTQQYPD